VVCKPTGIRDPERTKEALLVAAQKVAFDKGIRAMTLEEVAAAASVSKGGLLHHFPSKQALIAGITEHMLAEFDQEIESYRVTDPAFPGAYTRAFLRASQLCDEEAGQVCMALMSELRDLPIPLELFRRHSQECQKKMEADGLDPVVAAVIRYAGEGLTSARTCGMPRPSNYSAIMQYLLKLAEGSPSAKLPVRLKTAKKK
jgi:AcrR family transcriptional regulator